MTVQALGVSLEEHLNRGTAKVSVQVDLQRRLPLTQLVAEQHMMHVRVDADPGAAAPAWSAPTRR